MNRDNSGPIPTYGFAHANVPKSIFSSKTLGLVPHIGIILKDLKNWIYSTTKNWVKLTWVENLKNQGIQPTQRVNFTEFGLPETANRLSTIVTT